MEILLGFNHLSSYLMEVMVTDAVVAYLYAHRLKTQSFVHPVLQTT